MKIKKLHAKLEIKKKIQSFYGKLLERCVPNLNILSVSKAGDPAVQARASSYVWKW
jgi:hypothetical protein